MRNRTLSLLRASAVALVGGVLFASMTPIAATAAPSTYEVTATIPVGQTPYGIAVNTMTNLIYVPNSADDTVTVIDGNSATVVSTINVGDNPQSIAVNETTNTIYVANHSDDSVTVISGATGAVTATISLADPMVSPNLWPYEITVNETTNTVYTANLAHSVSVIDGATGMVSSISLLPSTAQPTAITVNEVANVIYVADYIDSTLRLIDGSSHVVVTSVPAGPAPFGLAYNDVTNTLYMSNIGDASVWVLDPATLAHNASIVVGASPFGVAVDTTRNTIFVANSSAGSVSIINGATNGVTDSLAMGNNPHRIAVNALTNTVYVANPDDNSVSVLRSVDAPLIAPDPLPAGVVGTAFSTTPSTTGATPMTYTVSAGALPTGLTLNSSTGLILGTPIAAGTATFTITATNTEGVDSQVFSIVTTAAALAATGVDTVPWGIAGALLLLLGAGLTLSATAKRRRQAA